MGLPHESHRPAAETYWRHILAGFLFSFFVGAAFPPVGVWPLTLVAILPLVWAAYHPARRPSLGALCVSLGALPFWFLQERWLIRVTEIGYPLLALYLAAYAGGFVMLLAWTSRRLVRGGWVPPGAVLVPILWVGLEFFRGEIALTGYAWFLVAQPLIESPFLAAPAALLGTYFVSFLVAAFAGALADATGWTPTSRRTGGIGAGVICVVWLATSVMGRTGEPDPNDAVSVRVAVVQTNLPQDNKIGWSPAQREQDFERFVKLTRDAAALRPRPDLICWPETMYPGAALNAEYIDELSRLATSLGVDPLSLSDVVMARRLVDLQVELGIPILVGTQSLENYRIIPGTASTPATSDAVRYNSVCIIDSLGVRRERYDKVELTPFGEVIPYLWRWKAAQAWIEHIGAGGMKFDLAVGARAVALALDITQGTISPPKTAKDRTIALSLLTPICFEATKSSHCLALARAASRSHPDRHKLLINVSNDGWFGDAAGKREQHLLAARWRCVELGIPMVRAVNTGISCFIDTAGRVRIGSEDAAVPPLPARSSADPSAPTASPAVGTGTIDRESTVSIEGVFAETVILAADTSSVSQSHATVYQRLGPFFGWIVMAAAAMLPIAVLFLSRRSRTSR